MYFMAVEDSGEQNKKCAQGKLELPQDQFYTKRKAWRTNESLTEPSKQASKIIKSEGHGLGKV